MDWWGFGYKRFRFPDLGLNFFPLKKMVKAIREVVSRERITILVSFNPNEIVSGFDHSDHNRAGEIARLVSVSMGGRRGLIFWESSGRATRTGERIKYVKEFYPSQKIPGNILKKLGESYLLIR